MTTPQQPKTKDFSKDIDFEKLYGIPRDALGRDWTEEEKAEFRRIYAQTVSQYNPAQPMTGGGLQAFVYSIFYWIQTTFKVDLGIANQEFGLARSEFSAQQATIALYEGLKASPMEGVSSLATKLSGQTREPNAEHDQSGRNVLTQLETYKADGTRFERRNGGSLNYNPDYNPNLTQNDIAPPPATPTGTRTPTQANLG